MHSDKFIMKVMEYRKKEYKSRDVARILGDEYTKRTGRKMTRNVVIGIWNRNLPKNRKVGTYKTRDMLNDEIHQEYKDRTAKGEKVRLRKCLSCTNVMVLNHNNFICDNCKKKNENIYYSEHGVSTYAV